MAGRGRIWSNRDSIRLAHVVDDAGALERKFARLGRSWLMSITTMKASDWFADWSTCLGNFATMARACPKVRAPRAGLMAALYCGLLGGAGETGMVTDASAFYKTKEERRADDPTISGAPPSDLRSGTLVAVLSASGKSDRFN